MELDLEARDALVCAIQDHKLDSVAGFDQSKYKMWFDPCYKGPGGGPAGGVGWAVRVGRERCVSVAHLPGAGPSVEWISLSVESPGAGKSTFDLASAYVPPQGAPGKTHVAIRDEVLGVLDATSGRRPGAGRL